MRAILVAGVVMAGALLAAPALAAPVSTTAYPDCPTARFCLWTGQNGTGSIAMFTVGDADLRRGPVVPRRASASNRTKTPWCLYGRVNYQDLLVVVQPGVPANLPASARDRVMSLKPCSSATELAVQDEGEDGWCFDGVIVGDVCRR